MEQNTQSQNDLDETVKYHIDFSQEIVGIKIALQNKTNNFYAVSMKFFTNDTNLWVFKNTNINKHIRGKVGNDNLLFLHKKDPKKPLGELIIVVGYKQIDRDTYLDNAAPVFAHVDEMHTIQLKLDKTEAEALAEEYGQEEDGNSNQNPFHDYEKFSRQESGISNDYNLLTENQQMDLLIRKASFNQEKSEATNTQGDNAETESNNELNNNQQNQESLPSSETQTESQPNTTNNTEETGMPQDQNEINLKKTVSVVENPNADDLGNAEEHTLRKNSSM